METYTDTDDTDRKATTLNLITHVAVERAHESDARALMPAIESARQRDLTTGQLLADSLYGSDENIQTAKDNGVDVAHQFQKIAVLLTEKCPLRLKADLIDSIRIPHPS